MNIHVEATTPSPSSTTRQTTRKKVIRFEDLPSAAKDLQGKTIVFTGGTDGMGRVALDMLADMGATLWVLGRSEAKTKGVVNLINEGAPTPRAHYVHLDLADQSSIRACATTLLERCPKIDLLINCAGANLSERRMTEDDLEMTWAVNHVGPFLLTQLLKERLLASSPARIVNLSSATEKYGHIRLHDIHLERRWSVGRAYAQAKLAMNMCTRVLARELQDTGVTVNALNPGWIDTRMAKGTEITGWRSVVGGTLSRFFAEPLENGAKRIVTLALAPQYEGVSGQFVYEDHVRRPNREALDEDLVQKVWNLSLQHAGLA